MNAIQYFVAFIQDHFYTLLHESKQKNTLIKIHNKVKNNKEI